MRGKLILFMYSFCSILLLCFCAIGDIKVVNKGLALWALVVSFVVIAMIGVDGCLINPPQQTREDEDETC